jgi:hypothetical protein
MNLTNYLELTTAPNVIWTALLRINLAAIASAVALNPYHIALWGNVTNTIEPATAGF